MPIEMNGSGSPNALAIRAHLADVLRSRQFAAAPRLSCFLSFIVESKLGGKATEVKESLIAIEVFGRPTNYNPQVDSTVRVEAWRLRAKLREYYESSGKNAALTIELPKGNYVPVFHERPASPIPATPPSACRPYVLVAIGALVLAAIGVGGAKFHPMEKPDSEILRLYGRGVGTTEALSHRGWVNSRSGGERLEIDPAVSTGGAAEPAFGPVVGITGGS